MPEYSLICETCGHTFTDVHAMTAEHPPCPGCKGTTRVDWRRQNAPRVQGDEIRDEKQQETPDVLMQREEVPRARELFAPAGVGHCIQPDGKVKFGNKTEAKRYFKRENEIRNAAAIRRAEREAKGLPPAPKRNKRQTGVEVRRK